MRRGNAGLRVILLAVLPLIAVVGGVFWWLSGGRYVSTDNAYVKAHIVQIAPEISGQVRRVLVRDHQEVKAGESLMTIESRPFKLALDSAEAELDAARSQVETLRGTWREVVAELTDAEARAEFASGAVRSLWTKDYDAWQRGNLIGTPEQVSERLRAYQDMGCSYIVPWCSDYPSDQTVRLLASSVIPNFRSRR
jgi:multidrug resistance efflux pump